MSISQQNLTEINNLINRDVEFVKARKFSTLTVGKIYLIKKINIVPTRYGKSVVVTLYDRTHDSTFHSFLPKHVVETLTDEVVQSMNNDRYTLTYLGKSSQVSYNGNSRSQLNFGVLE